MPLNSRFAPFRKGHLTINLHSACRLSALILACATATAWGQAPPATTTRSSQVKPVATPGPLWGELSQHQQKVLSPLARGWESLEPDQKRKWMALALTYPRLAPAEQTKLQGRMSEWAALSPRDRALARLNFSESKKLPGSDRAADWDAYKALPPEDRQKFVAEAASGPKGAALAPKRSTVDKVTPVPVTRRTPTEELANSGVTIPSIDRKTLLPPVPKPTKAAASSPTN